MSSSNVTKGPSTTQPNGNRRQTADSSRVAIPLPLTKLKARPQAKLDEKAQSNGGSHVKTESKDNEEKQVVPTAIAVDAAQSVANGHIVEAVKNGDGHATQPSALPTASGLNETMASTTSAGSSSPRKLLHTRTELPPPFIPSAEQLTRIQPQLPSFAAYYQPPAKANAEARGIIFGGDDSSGSSPVPLQQSEDTMSMPPPKQIPFRPTPSPGYPPPNHTHHFSEPQATHFYHPSHPPPQAPWATSRQPHSGQQQPPHQLQPHYFPSHGVPPFRFPPTRGEPFSPTEFHNGFSANSRSDSPGSATAVDFPRAHQPDLRSPSDLPVFHPHQRPPPSLNHRTFPQAQPPQADMRLQPENAQLLRQHVHSVFSSPSFSDVHLQVVLDRDGSIIQRSAHKLVLARSPTLLDLITVSNVNDFHSTQQVLIRLPGNWITFHAFDEALEWLYGGPLHGDRGSVKQQFESNEAHVRHALAYIAVGHFERLPLVAQRGVEVVSSLLHWDTIALALSFALDGGLNRTWRVDEEARNSGDASASTSEAELNGMATYDPFATQLLHSIVAFVASALPPNFYPDTTAAELRDSPRLPTSPSAASHSKSPSFSSPVAQAVSHQHSRSANDPRLSRIRFGELGGLATAPEEPIRPSPVTTIVSSLLFSLPFDLLKGVLEHPVLTDRLGLETVGSIARQVIVERESRRAKAIKAQREANGQVEKSKNDQLQANLYWEEGIEANPHSRSGLRLVRTKVAQSSC